MLDGLKTHVTHTFPQIDYGPFRAAVHPFGGIQGSFAYSKTGIIRVIHAPKFELEQGSGVLPGDAARMWIRENYHLPIRRRNDQKRSYPLPMLARRGEWGECVYIDVKSAYKTILVGVGYDVDYRLGSYVAINPTQLPSLLDKNKLCYSMIVACSAKPTTTIIRRNKTGSATSTFYNIYANTCLYAICSEALASVASVLDSSVPLYYAHTDGFILPERYEAIASRIIEDFGFGYSIKARGLGEVYGVGRWKVGDTSTQLRGNITGKWFKGNLPPIDKALWLQKRLQRILR